MSRKSSGRSAIVGLDNLNKKFAELSKLATHEQQVTALLKAGEPIAEEARLRVPVRYGDLKAAIGVREVGKNKKFGGLVHVAVIGRPAVYYAHMVEYGTKPHLIKVPANKVLRLGAIVLGRVVRHPGAAASPFMRPAADLKHDEAMQIYGEELRRLVLGVARG